MNDPTYNPSAPPAAAKDGTARVPFHDAPRTRTTDRAPGEALKWFYLSLSFFSLASSVAAQTRHSEYYRFAGSIGLINAFVAMAWIFQSWNGVPSRFRRGVRRRG